MTTPSDLGQSKAAIVIPVFNQLHYTRQCLDGLNRAGVTDGQIIIINNASTDGTAEFLAARPQVRTINNADNRGCGFAWTQGAKLSDQIWTIVMNNDVLVPPGCTEGLISFAEENRCDLVSPAMCEGELNYDFPAHAADFMQRLKDAQRHNVAHGVCFMVHRRVFESIGYFDGDPRLGGYEDDEYFRRARGSGFRLAITGRAFLHHFGSITQKSIQAGTSQKRKSLGDREYYRHKTGQTWPKRKIHQIKQAVRGAWWKRSELGCFGCTLWEKRVGGRSEFV
jgi:N-acetylglucosaminyl-diphospho-decaprenol L-rhamnosyltransferase